MSASEFRRLASQDPAEAAQQLSRLLAERDEARQQLDFTMRTLTAVMNQAHAERDRLRDALRRARLDVTDVGTSGWDSTRLERTKEAVARIDAALAESEETT